MNEVFCRRVLLVMTYVNASMPLRKKSQQSAPSIIRVAQDIFFSDELNYILHCMDNTPELPINELILCAGNFSSASFLRHYRSTPSRNLKILFLEYHRYFFATILYLRGGYGMTYPNRFLTSRR